jgi:4-diphosphocytidyl-2-C-methyl-D-erythritol kinase
MALYDVPAPAKINLFLHVTGRRPDGYHTLQTAFRFIDLCDTLSFEMRSDGNIVREGEPVPGLVPDQDLVVRAARALQQATGTTHGALIAYNKVIPSGAGLGGGSSDAATTLIALNKLWNTGLDRRELMRLALALGADVPVFIYGQAAFAEGIGEVLTPIELPPKAYVVVQPAQDVPTKGVFSAPDLTRDTPCVKIAVFADWQKKNAPKDGYEADGNDVSGYKPNGYKSSSLFGRNDLSPVVYAKYPSVAAAHKLLQAWGYSARMTGSGSCLFVEFANLQQAGLCQQQIVAKMSSRKCSETDYDTAVIKNSWVCTGLMDHPLRYWVCS